PVDGRHGLVDEGEATLPVLGGDQVRIDVDDLPEEPALAPQRVCDAPCLRDVPKAPDPADRPSLDRLRPRVALEASAVLELEHVEALGIGGRVELPDLAQELFGREELV